MDILYQLLEVESGYWERRRLYAAPSRLRFVVKLHHATRLHYDFRLELYGQLFSLVINDLADPWPKSVTVVRVGDHDLEGLLTERRIPPGRYGAGPMLVWDHGVYASDGGTEADVYRQLQSGRLEIELAGHRLNGRYRIDCRTRPWRLTRLTGIPPSASKDSILTGRTLAQIGLPTQTMPDNTQQPALFDT